MYSINLTMTSNIPGQESVQKVDLTQGFSNAEDMISVQEGIFKAVEKEIFIYRDKKMGKSQDKVER